MLKLGPVPWKVDVDIHPGLIFHHIGESDPVLEQAPEFGRLEKTGRQARLFKDSPESVSGAGVILTPLSRYGTRSGPTDHQIQAGTEEIIELRAGVHSASPLSLGAVSRPVVLLRG